MANLSKCRRCGKDIQVSSTRATNQRFCNEDCRDSWWNEKRSQNVTRGEWEEKRYGPVDRKNLAEVEKVWLAAIMDGEGCIAVTRTYRQKNKSGYRYVAYASFANTNKDLIDRFNLLVEGWNHYQKKNGHGDNNKPIWNVTVKGRGLKEFLTAIRPYLVAKQRQADNALEFLDALAKAPMRTSRDHDVFEHYWKISRQLNQRGRKALVLS